MAVLATSLSAQDFTVNMTAEERQATGLDKLDAAELARLKAVIERYKAGEVAMVRQAAEEQVAAAELKVKAAATEAEKTAEAGRKAPGWFTGLVSLQRAGNRPEASEALQMKLKGTLRTFNGRRRFTLEDGQVWTMVEHGSYAGPLLQDPLVHIQPGLFGVFWLKIPEAGLRVKVTPVKLE